MPDESWRSHAECAGMDPNLFFPPDGMRNMALTLFIRDAVNVCADCPVRGECLTYARETGQHWGVWGGRDMSDDRIMPRDGKNNKSYVGKCIGGCGRPVATPSLWQPGYERTYRQGMCSSCTTRNRREREGQLVRREIKARHDEVLRQRRQGIPLERIAINTNYSPRNVERILEKHRETAQ